MKKVLSVLIFFSFNLTLSAGNLLTQILEENDQKILQQTANLLMFLVSTPPNEADFINKEIGKAKTTALDIVQSICPITLNKLQSEPIYKIERYEQKLNEQYKKIRSKLDQRYSKIIYGPRKGKQLPQEIHFFPSKKTKLSLEDNDPHNELYFPFFTEKFSC